MQAGLRMTNEKSKSAEMVAQKLVKIREFKPTDMRAVLDIEYKSFPDPYPPSLLGSLYEAHPDGFLVAELNGEVVGYVIGALRWGRTGHIMAIAVDPLYRRRGIGRLMMEEIIRRLRVRGAREIGLEVRKGNLTAQRFYAKLGFEKRGEVPYYYGDGETAVLMSLKCG